MSDRVAISVSIISSIIVAIPSSKPSDENTSSRAHELLARLPFTFTAGMVKIGSDVEDQVGVVSMSRYTSLVPIVHQRCQISHRLSAS